MRNALCLVAAMLLLVTGCSAGSEQAPGQRTVTESKGPAGSVPAGLGAYYGQSLRWGACAPYASSPTAGQAFAASDLQCARLQVPLDYAKPDGKKISLGLLRRPATGQRIGSLLTNPGGPGVSGMEAAASLAKQAAGNELGKRFDLVGFDPRGIGASEPRISCLTGAERDRQRAEDADLDTSPAGVAKNEAQQRDYADKCAERTTDGADMLAHMGTRDVVKDMDVLRSALGDKQLTYAGFSYGTRIGSAYAEQFPKNVRAMVLDGAVDPDQEQLTSVIAQRKGFQEAFDKFSAWCAQQQQCAVGKDPNGATKQFQDLTRGLIGHPIRLADGRELTYDDATTGVTQALYSKQFWQPLNMGLGQLREGNGRVLMALADMYEERYPSGKYSTTQDANMAVHCLDDPRETDRNKLKTAEGEADKVAPFLDDGKPATGELDACAFWKVKANPLPATPKVAGVAPTLTISTTNDPATPYQAGVNLAKALGGGLLTNEGTQHTAFLQGDKCIDKAASDYLVTKKLPPEGTRCPG